LIGTFLGVCLSSRADAAGRLALPAAAAPVPVEAASLNP